MEGIFTKSFFQKIKNRVQVTSNINNLSKGKTNRDYIVKEIKSTDKELSNFLFSLGCYEGERITLISNICDNYVINIKDARYSIDKELAAAIVVDEI